jgi:hypothetical protein
MLHNLPKDIPAMNEQSNQDREEKMQEMTDFEMRLSASVPKPREGFEAELAQHLRREFVQRRQARRLLTAVQPRRYGRLSAQAAAVLIAVLTIGIGVVIAMNTIFQQFIDHDAGLKAIYEQGLGHEIGVSQGHEGFTVTLEWAYADGNRLTLAYTIQGHPGTPYSNLQSHVYRLSLRDTGAEIPFYQGMNAAIDQNGEAVGWGAPADTIITFDRVLEIRTYDLSTIPIGDSTTLDLHLEVGAYGITWQRRTQIPLERMNEMYEGPESLFTFDFSIPLVSEQRVMNTPQTAADQGITLTLKQVTISPSQTRVTVCFTSPDPARQWTAIPHLTTHAGEVPGGGGVQPLQPVNDETCEAYTYFAGMFDYTGEWRLEVTELVGFGSGGGNDQQRISGSWVFEFVVP